MAYYDHLLLLLSVRALAYDVMWPAENQEALVSEFMEVMQYWVGVSLEQNLSFDPPQICSFSGNLEKGTLNFHWGQTRKDYIDKIPKEIALTAQVCLYCFSIHLFHSLLRMLMFPHSAYNIATAPATALA